MPHNYANAYVGNSLLRPADVRPVPFGEQDDTPIGLLVRYIGSQISGTVEVNAGGDILFKHGALGAEAADTTVSTDGTITVAGAAEDTFGEVVDVINLSANWEAVLVDVARSHTSTDALKVQAATQAKVNAGLQLVLDTDTAKIASRLIAPEAYRKDLRTYEKQGVVNAAFPFIGFRAALIRARSLSTFGAGTSTFKVYSELARSPYSQIVAWSIAGGATTVEKTYDFADGEIVCDQGGRLIVALENSAAMASTGLNGQGVFYRSLD